MREKFPELQKAIESAKIIELPQPGSKKYKFKAFAFGERGTKISLELLREITEGLCKSIKKNFPDFDYVVSPEPGGHTWGVLVALKLAKPINIIRPQPSYSKGELEVRRKIAYYQQNLHFSHFQKGDKVLIVDDVISTGGTLETILETLDSLDVKCVGVQAIHVKSGGYQRLSEKYSLPIRFLIK